MKSSLHLLSFMLALVGWAYADAQPNISNVNPPVLSTVELVSSSQVPTSGPRVRRRR